MHGQGLTAMRFKLYSHRITLVPIFLLPFLCTGNVFVSMDWVLLLHVESFQVTSQILLRQKTCQYLKLNTSKYFPTTS